MKPFFAVLAVAFCFVMSSCGSENRDNAMDDTMMTDTTMMDVDTTMNMDTTGVADTAGLDTMYRNSPATQ
jgi:hypothetical protein